MLYKGYFYTLKGEQYTVEVVTNRTSGATRYITLGVSPFVTEMESSEDNLYKPAKYQSATVKVITSGETDYKFDVYSSSPNGTSIKLFDENDNVKWCGFATPNLYNIGFKDINEELEIECIDALSTLQYYKYEAPTKSIKSFAEIFLEILLPKCELYTNVYVSESVYTADTKANATPILNDLYISEKNFFDDKTEEQTDDDVAWTCQEVLEQMCQFLGYTCIANGDSVYLLDYDDIAYGDHYFTQYTVGNTTPVATNVLLQDMHTIIEADYMGGNNTLSMTSTYNHIKVKDNFYTFDSVMPSIFDKINNITASADTALATSEKVQEGMYGEVVPNSEEGNVEGDINKNMICLVDKVYNPTFKPGKSHYTTPNAIFVKYFTSPYFKTYQYSGTTATSLVQSSFNDNGKTCNFTDTKTMLGAVVCKFDVEKLDKDLTGYVYYEGGIIHKVVPLDYWLSYNKISSVNFNNYIAMFNQSAPYITNELAENYPYLETTLTDNSALFGGENAYLIIKGDYIWHYFNDDPYPIPNGEDIDITEGRYYMQEGTAYILGRLQWGNQYWDGSGWTVNNRTFKMPYFEVLSTKEERRADATIFNNLPIANNVSWRIGTTEKGYLIPVPNVIAGTPKLTLYKPIDPFYFSSKSGDYKGQWYKHYVVFLKDFEIKAIIGDPTYSNVNNTDTVYESQISDGVYQSSTDFGDVEFKICTHDGKKPNYSSVAVKDGSGNYQYLDNHISLRRWANYDRMERHYINKFVNQYEQPNVKLTLQLDNTVQPYQTFWCRWLTNVPYLVVDSQSIDFYNNQTTITLIQKR